MRFYQKSVGGRLIMERWNGSMRWIYLLSRVAVFPFFWVVCVVTGSRRLENWYTSQLQGTRRENTLNKHESTRHGLHLTGPFDFPKAEMHEKNSKVLTKMGPFSFDRLPSIPKETVYRTGLCINDTGKLELLTRLGTEPRADIWNHSETTLQLGRRHGISSRCGRAEPFHSPHFAHCDDNIRIPW
ncbi:hypothetical protein TNIN_278671 [Trichonephila inaurata madagascariensis]|uniref:Uncharacterized protein n=1 Tax=Trichonephila inaurata madagascariensis TaxID=2747483 RepID=A0A8X6YG96_9ARAC|nr:hypothetical protein TNIN_278671 [Trichonephila inaurata madagascariensis]